MNSLVTDTLRNVCSLVTDGTHDTPKSVMNGFPLVKAKDIAQGRIDFNTCQKISLEDHRKVIARSKPEKGDTLFVNIGASLGAAVYVNSTEEFSIKNVALFKPNPQRIVARYLYYLVVSPQFQAEITSRCSGAAQPFLGLDTLRTHQISYHQDKRTQRRIAAILSAYDDLIENNTRRIQILEEMARLIYEEWFVRFCFPGHENVSMVEGELGLIPGGWSVTTLDTVATINSLSVRRGNEPTHILYVDIASVSTGKIDNVQEISFIEAPGRARRIVKHGDIIWSNVRPNRKSFALITNPPQNMIVSTGFTVISASSVPYSFLYHALTTEDFTSYLTNRAKGAAYPAVGSEDFANAKIIIPSSELLSTFDEMAEPMQKEKNFLLEKNVVLNRTRDLLLPKLISGEIDVSNFDEPLSH
jgi:type I restriction enzyme S subunit